MEAWSCGVRRCGRAVLNGSRVGRVTLEARMRHGRWSLGRGIALETRTSGCGITCIPVCRSARMQPKVLHKSCGLTREAHFSGGGATSSHFCERSRAESTSEPSVTET